MTVRPNDEGRIVIGMIMKPNPRGAVVLASSSESLTVKLVYLTSIVCREGDVNLTRNHCHNASRGLTPGGAAFERLFHRPQSLLDHLADAASCFIWH